MPRSVDKVERDRAIMHATLQLISQGGFAAVTLRRIADILGGSITLVTHYYPTRDALLRSFVDGLSREFMSDLERRERGATSRARLSILLDWLIPNTDEAVQIELARVLMSGDRRTDDYAQEFLDANENHMMQLLREHLRDLVDEADVEPLARMLRTFTNGIVLSTIEHPDIWTVDARKAALQDLLVRLQLHDPVAESVSLVV